MQRSLLDQTAQPKKMVVLRHKAANFASFMVVYSMKLILSYFGDLSPSYLNFGFDFLLRQALSFREAGRKTLLLYKIN